MSYITGPSVATFTVATLPASYATGLPVYVSNAGNKGSHWYYDGTRWRPVGTPMLKTLSVASSNIPNAESIVTNYQLPAGLLQATDRLRVSLTMTKSGTTDSGTLRFRMGTAGTTADTQIYTGNAIAAASRTTAVIVDFRLEDTTHLLQLGINAAAAANIGYSATAANAFGASVAITDASANALYFSIGILSSSTNDTVALQDAQLMLIAGT